MYYSPAVKKDIGTNHHQWMKTKQQIKISKQVTDILVKTIVAQNNSLFFQYNEWFPKQFCCELTGMP